MMLPEVRSTPCFDCPWRRNAVKGWLGPYTAEEWQQLVHSDEAIACHTTLPSGDEDVEDLSAMEIQERWLAEGVRQCAGAAIYRTHIFKSPRDPQVATLPSDKETVFGMGEFVPYHTQ